MIRCSYYFIKFIIILIFFAIRKAHKDTIISIAVKEDEPSNNIIATSSEDKTIRLWDLRINSSIKLYTDEKLKNLEIANLLFSAKDKILVAASN